MIPPLTDRISLLELVNSRFPNGVGVEIGVAGGHFTKQIVATWKTMGQLSCVDAWRHFDEGYEDSCNLSDQVQEERYQQFVKDFGDNPKIVPIRMLSTEAAALFQPESADFIYLDANHSEKGATEDTEAWWPKLRRGGIMAGHDYYPGNGAGHGVKLAVDKFAAKHKIQVHRTTSEFCRKDGVYGAGWEGVSFCFEKI